MAINFFGGTSKTFGWQPIQLDLSVLATPVNTTPLLSNRDLKNFTAPAVVAPWADPSKSGGTSTEALVRKALASKSLFDRNAPGLSAAGDNKDLKTLFSLYQALNTLTALAEKGASKTISDAYRRQLNDRFQAGLAELQSYLLTAPTDQVKMLYGGKKAMLETVTIPKAARTYDGLGLVAETAAGSIKGLEGNEKFTITLSTGTRSDTITIDLSEIEGTISVNAVVNLINRQITSRVMTDSNGDPVISSNGKTMPLYDTRAEAYKTEDGKWGIRFNGNSVETITLGDPTVGPSLYVATGNQKGSEAAVGGLRRIDDATGTLKTPYYGNTVVAGIDSNATALAKASGATEKKSGETDAKDPTVNAPTTVRSTAVDSKGFVYVVGTSSGDFGTQKNDGGNGLFLTKYAPDGSMVYSRLIAEGETEGYGIAIDKDDNVIVVGSTTGKLTDRDVFSGQDSFVRRYGSDGTLHFTVQLDGVSVDAATAVTTDANGDIYIAGNTRGPVVSGQTAQGSSDIFVAKIDAGPRAVEGIPSRVLSVTQFGTSGADTVADIAIGPDGQLLVAGTENGQAIVRKLDTTTLGQLDQVNLGNATLTGIAVDETTGAIAVVGSTTTGALNAGPATGAFAGATDGFLARLDSALTAQGVTYLGTAGVDRISDVIASNGEFYVTGTTSGVLAGTGKKGSTDAFVSRLDAATGAIEDTIQFGAVETATSGVSLVLNPVGHSSTLEKLGLRSGVLNPPQSDDLFSATGLKAGDHFYISVGSTTRKVTVQQGDTLERLAARIRSAFPSDLTVTVSSLSSGSKLQFKNKSGKEITFSAGGADNDALGKLGLAPGKLYSADVLYGVDTQGKDSKGKTVSNALKPGGSFALELDSSLALTNEKASAYVAKVLADAVETIKRAYRSLYYDPNKMAMEQQARFAGKVPDYLTKQIASYQDALARLTGGS